MTRSAKYPVAEVRSTVRGHLPGAEDYAIRRVTDALRVAPEPVLAARVKLAEHANPAAAHYRVVAQANVDLRGRLVRAQATAATVTEAVDQLHDRLKRRLEKYARNWEARRGHVPNSEGWRHGQEHVTHERVPRPTEEREIVRHKTFSLTRVSVATAIDELESLDYDFHLFTEETTGLDSVLRRTPDGYRLAQTTVADPPIPDGVPVTLSEHPAVELTVEQAVERLSLTGYPFLFFVEPQQHRGRLLYHRHDGHYGLITPADQ